ncbi:MAG: cohesin domain-containing protein, partial [Paenibacillus macerans]|nr:cohesin domain-containing protein [Paenibacillus macerans]
GYSNEVSATPSAVALNPVLAVIINEDTVTVGQEFDATISLKNVDKIYAEDFTINYDTTLFKYLGYEEITGYKVYNESADKSGNIRFIIASQGEEYGIHEDTTILKLKFRAISIGTGDVDALRGRIADTEREFDLDEENCLLDSVIVEAVTVDDVNRSGEYTLVDLAIDGYYFGKAVADTDTARHSADQVIDGYVNDEDLVYIVNQMLNNANYSRNL